MPEIAARKLDSARPAMVSTRGAATCSARTTATGARAVHFYLIGGYRVRRKGGAAGDSVLYRQLGYKMAS